MFRPQVQAAVALWLFGAAAACTVNPASTDFDFGVDENPDASADLDASTINADATPGGDATTINSDAACTNCNLDAGSPNPDAAFVPDATPGNCGPLVPPNNPAGCTDCMFRMMPNCPANGCYGGYWCNTVSQRCQQAPPPAMCSSSGDAGLADTGVVLSNSVQIIVEPADHATALLSSITNAQVSVHVTIYLLSDMRIINALIDRHNAGVEVKVLLNQQFPMGAGSNTTTYQTLSQAGVAVAWAPSSFTYTHEKCVIIDGQAAWIMTMNLTASASTDNREYLAIDSAAADVQEAETIFAADFAGNPPSNVSGGLVVAPINARASLLAMINGATQTVDLEGEEFSDYMVSGALASAAQRGVTVRVIVANNSPTASQTTAITQVKTAGATVVATASPYIHAKAMVVDHSSAYVGSENFSTGSLQHNRELGVIFAVASEVAKVSAAINIDYNNGQPQ